MFKKSALLAAALAAIVSASASADSSTVTIGYAQGQSAIEEMDDVKGFNVKYHYDQSASPVGFVGSFTYAGASNSIHYQGVEFDLDGDFYSLSIGPSYRLGDSTTIYGLIGGAYNDVEIQASGVKKGGSGIGVSYGLGMRFTPVGNLVIDSSWEQSRVGLSDVDGDAGIFTIGLGVTY